MKTKLIILLLLISTLIKAQFAYTGVFLNETAMSSNLKATTAKNGLSVSSVRSRIVLQSGSTNALMDAYRAQNLLQIPTILWNGTGGVQPWVTSGQVAAYKSALTSMPNTLGGLDIVPFNDSVVGASLIAQNGSSGKNQQISVYGDTIVATSGSGSTHFRLHLIDSSTANVNNMMWMDANDEIHRGNGSGTVSSANLTGQTSSNASVATYTTGASDSTFNIQGYLTVTSVSGGAVKLSVAYRDESNTSRTIDFFSMGSTAASLLATGVSSFPVLSIRVKASTTITVSTTATGTITYDVGTTITKIR
jgi:hypothetical protein